MAKRKRGYRGGPKGWRYIRITKLGKLTRGIEGPGVYVGSSIANLPDDTLLRWLTKFHQPAEYDLRLQKGAAK